jgi:hypothetical protein
MRIERISPETHPKEFEALNKMVECRGRGHGTLNIDPDGFITCHDCRELLVCLLEPDYVDWEDPDSDGADTPERDD